MGGFLVRFVVGFLRRVFFKGGGKERMFLERLWINFKYIGNLGVKIF